MFPARRKSIFAAGTRIRVTHYVRVGGTRWQTTVEGVVEREDHRPVGGIEMEGKASYASSSLFACGSEDIASLPSPFGSK
jgi:hypothetical protein